MKYKAFNLQFNTPFECPELLPVDSVGSDELEQVEIRFGETPKHLESVINEGITFEANANEVLLKIETIGRFLIRNGNEIIITKEDESSDDEIRLFLFGSALGALLQQRGYVTLHASAVTTEKGAVLFAGNSASGKSTTLHEFLRREYKMLSDDIVAIYYDESSEKIMCVPSYPYSKLWEDSLHALKMETLHLKQIRNKLQKFALSTPKQFETEPVPLHSIYTLSAHNQESVHVETTSAVEAFGMIRRHTYRKKYFTNLPYFKHYFNLISLIAKQHQVYNVTRSGDENSLKKLADMIESTF